jgi:hypothetical protein
MSVWLQLNSDFVAYVNIFMEPSDYDDIPLCKELYCVRGMGSNVVEEDGFLRAIKVRSTTSFGGKVKPACPCDNTSILRHVKEPLVV